MLGKSDAEISSFVASNLRQFAGIAELCLLSNPDKRFGGIGHVGNRVLERTLCDVFGMVHADTTFENGALDAFTKEAWLGSVAGMVGRTLDGHYVWSKDVSKEIVRTEVSTLDSCAVFFRPRGHAANELLTFDTQLFDDFHCAIEDLCLRARHHHDMPVVVPAAKAMHHGKVPDPNGPWAERYRFYRSRLAQRWMGFPFQTT